MPNVAAMAELERIAGARGRLPPPPKAAENPMSTMKTQMPMVPKAFSSGGNPTTKLMTLVTAKSMTRMYFLLMGRRSDHAPESGFITKPMSVMIEVMKPAVPISKPMLPR